jgi:hypothetical protein
MNYIKAFLIAVAIFAVFGGILWTYGTWVGFLLSFHLSFWVYMALSMGPIVVLWAVWLTVSIGQSFGRKP